MPTDTNTLMDSAKCIDCNIPPGMQLAVLIALFGKVAGVTDPNQMMDMAKCIDCQIPSGMQMSVLIALADKLQNG